MTRDGGRPLLIELQALVDRMRFGAPRRIAQGLDANRLAMLLAVMNRHAGVSLQEHDVFVNVVGGIEIARDRLGPAGRDRARLEPARTARCRRSWSRSARSA